jgi:hypothetical protein
LAEICGPTDPIHNVCHGDHDYGTFATKAECEAARITFLKKAARAAKRKITETNGLITGAGCYGHHRAGDWEFGYSYEEEGGELISNGSTKELSGKGTPLILERCLAGGSVLSFAIDMEGQILEGSLYRLGWIFVQGEENCTPIVMDGGINGWYFTWVLADRKPIIGGAILSICPSNDAKSSKCRTFSSKGMREAAAFLCRGQHSPR